MAYEDLLKDTSQRSADSQKFIVTVTDLNVNSVYPIQFRWKYTDGSFGGWSAAKILVTPSEISPATPSKLTVTGGAGIITVSWDGKSSSNTVMTNIDRVDIYIDGYPFDSTKPAGEFKVAGTKTFSAPPGTYIVSCFAVSTSGVLSAFAEPTFIDVVELGIPVIDPVDPSAPSIKSGLASIIVSWDGKTSSNTDFPAGSFEGANIYIGKTSDFTPSNNNRVHSLNFANGANQVSVGVGTVIDKTTNETLAYGTTYYIKIGTVNADGTGTGNYIASSPTNISVSKLPASEISTGTLTADNSITAGVTDGQRVVISGSESPFIIYGTDGTTKLLEYIADGTEGKLTIKGDGSFTGDISGATGTLTNALNVGPISGGKYPFSVNSSGVIRSTAGEIGGWTLTENYLKSANLELNSTNSAIYVGATNTDYIKISSSGGIQHVSSSGVPTGKFSLDTNGLTLTGDIHATSGVFEGEIFATSGWLGSLENGWNISDYALIAGNAGGVILLGEAGVLEIGTTEGATQTAPKALTSFNMTTDGYFEISQLISDGTLQGTSIQRVLSTGLTLESGSLDPYYRIHLGDETRSVDVLKSGPVSGLGSTSSDKTLSPYRSGALRNMFTVTALNYSSSVYPAADAGDVLLVWDA